MNCRHYFRQSFKNDAGRIIQRCIGCGREVDLSSESVTRANRRAQSELFPRVNTESEKP